MHKIKQKRMGLKISQWKLSILSGVSRYKLQLIEAGYIKPTQLELAKINAGINSAKNQEACG